MLHEHEPDGRGHREGGGRYSALHREVRHDEPVGRSGAPVEDVVARRRRRRCGIARTADRHPETILGCREAERWVPQRDARHDPLSARVDPEHDAGDRIGHPDRTRSRGDGLRSRPDRHSRHDVLAVQLHAVEQAPVRIDCPGRPVGDHERAEADRWHLDPLPHRGGTVDPCDGRAGVDHPRAPAVKRERTGVHVGRRADHRVVYRVNRRHRSGRVHDPDAAAAGGHSDIPLPGERAFRRLGKPNPAARELNGRAGVELQHLGGGDRQSHLRRRTLDRRDHPERPLADCDRHGCSDTRQRPGWSGLAGLRVDARQRPIVGVQHPYGTVPGGHRSRRRPHPDRRTDIVGRGPDRDHRVAGNRRWSAGSGEVPRCRADDDRDAQHERDSACDRTTNAAGPVRLRSRRQRLLGDDLDDLDGPVESLQVRALAGVELDSGYVPGQMDNRLAGEDLAGKAMLHSRAARFSAPPR